MFVLTSQESLTRLPHSLLLPLESIDWNLIVNLKIGDSWQVLVNALWWFYLLFFIMKTVQRVSFFLIKKYNDIYTFNITIDIET